jgi:F0F1-type ATP synthase membrane subunit b/b'
MTDIKSSSETQEAVFTHSLSDYRSKVGEIIRTENERFRELAEEQAQGIIDNAWKKAEEIVNEGKEKAKAVIAEGQDKASAIISDSRQKASEVGNEIERQANQKASEMISRAKREAEQIVSDVEERTKAEAKSRVRKQEEKILARAREEADSIIVDARKDAEKETVGIIERTKQEAEQRVEEEIERVRSQARDQSNQIRIEAEKKAAKFIDKVIDDGNVVNEMVIESIKNSESLLERMTNDMQVEIGKLTKDLMTARKNMEQAVTAFSERSENAELFQSLRKGLNKKLALWVTLKGNRTVVKDNGGFLFKGQIELKTLSTMSYALVKELKGFLTKVPNVKYLGESSGEEGSILSFEFIEPLPLLDILGSIPLVENVVEQGDTVKLSLN